MNNRKDQLPDVWLSNLPQISDPINELPLPIFRNDSSVYLVDNNSFSSTVSLLDDFDNNNNNKKSQDLLQTINYMISETSVSNIKIRSDIPNPQTDPSILLQSIYNHLPILKDKDRRVLSPIINQPSNNNTTSPVMSIDSVPSPFVKKKPLTSIGKENQQKGKENKDEIQLKVTTEKEKKKKVKVIQKQEEQIIMKPIEKLSNIINQFLDNVKEDRNHQIFNYEFFENLRKEIQTCSKIGALKEIPLEKYAQLIQYLIKFSKDPTVKVSLSYQNSDEAFQKNFKYVEYSLECCLLSFTILTMTDIGNSLCQLLEDELLEILSSLKFQIFENILGHLDPSFKTYKKQEDLEITTTKQQDKSKKTNGKKNDEEEDDIELEEFEDDFDEDDFEDMDDEEETGSNKKKGGKGSRAGGKKKSSNQQTIKKKNSTDSQKFNSLCNKVSEIFERVAHLVKDIVIPLETFVSLLLDCCTPTLFLEGISFIQFSSIHIIRNVFLKYPNERENILNDILSNCYKIIPGKNKKVNRPYKVFNDKSIQNISALLIQLVQNSINLPILKILEKGEDNSLENNNHSLKESQKYSKIIILFFIEKCSEKLEDSEVDFRILFENFIQDLLIVLNFPEWSGAGLILHLLSVTIVHIISKNTKSDNFRMTAIDILGTIVSKIKHEIVISKSESLSLLLPSLDSLKQQQQQQQISGNRQVKCHCMKFGIESFTIKCESCGDTFHDQCAPDFSKSSQNLLTEKWICISCRVKNQILNYINSITTKKVTVSDTIVNKKKVLKTKVVKSTTKKSVANKKRISRKKLPTEEEEEEEQEEEEEEEEKIHIDSEFSLEIENINDIKISDREIYQQLILNYLYSKGKGENWINSSKQFLISHWLDSSSDPTSKENRFTRHYFLSQFSGDSNYVMDSNCYVASDEEMKKIYRKLMIKDASSVFHFSNSLLYHLLNILVDSSIKARAKAMKSFIGIVEVDPSILAEEYVHTAIKNRFIDESISVREHTVDLIGKYILIKPELTFKYIDLICERISDKGISVRKRVVKTLNEICSSQPYHPKLPDICRILVSRINDDDAIRDLILKTFQDLWFSNSTTTTPTAATEATNSATKSIHEIEIFKVKQIIEVSKQLDQQDNWLIELIEKMLAESKAKLLKSKNKVDQVSQICTRICSTLIEMLVSLDERKSKSPQSAMGAIMQDYIGIFKTLYVFCKVDPGYLTPFVKVLHPYIKVNQNQIVSQEESLIFMHITHILEKVLPLIENPDSKFLEALELDLISLISKQGTAIVHSSIRCLCTVVIECSHNYSLVEELLMKSFHVLQTCQTRSKSEILRNLYTTGLLIRYYPFTHRRHFSLITQFKPDQVVSNVVPLIIQLYSFVKDKDVVSKALEAIGNIIISSPVILNKDYIKDVLYNSFSIQSDAKVKETVLNIFYDLLEKESKSLNKVDDEIKRESPDSTSNNTVTTKETSKPKPKPQKKRKNDSEDDYSSEESSENSDDDHLGLIVSMNVDQNSESLVTAVQKYFPSMVKFLLDTDRQVRFSAVETIHLIINQGILNPLDSVPSLVVLMTDNDQKIAEKALTTLTFINKKYTSSVHKSISESIQLTFKFHYQAAPTTTTAAVTYNNQINKGIGKFYSLFKNSKGLRTSFISMILEPFDTFREYKFKELNNFKFIFEILATLPFGNMDEVILVINSIDRLVSLNANFLKSEISEQLSAKLKLQNQKSISKKLRSHLITALVLTLLLQLKKFLLNTYQISKDKMKSYLDDSKDSDKLSSTLTDSYQFNDNNYPFSLIPSKEELKKNDNVQKNIYMEFKNLLKDDDQDEFSIKLGSGKKETAASKKRKQNALKETTNNSGGTTIAKPAASSGKKKPASKSRKKKYKVTSSDEDYED